MTQPLAHSIPLSGIGERIGRVKVGNLMSRNKNSLTKKKLGMQAKQTKKFIHYFPPQAGVQPSPGKQGSITHNGYLRRQTPSL